MKNSPKTLVLHTETICISSAFLFIIGLLQVMISLALRFMQRTLLIWYLYPEWAAASTLLPFSFALIYCANKKNCYVILVCISLILSFFASFAYVVLVVVNLFSSGLDENAQPTSFLIHYRLLIINSNNGPTFWDMLPFVILVLSIVQSLLSFAISVICFLWSQCCVKVTSGNKPFYGINYAQGGQASPLLTIRRRPNYCSDTLRSHIVPTSTLHRPNFNTNGLMQSNGPNGGANNALDDPSDIYMARSILRRQNIIDEV
ncbi:hypothetical protein GJ496_001618 [Pomphorhynchus laevis]|nr:hypothetical protein GJ496_001618 [Pomphorhynchus laevis]